jgi:hypothetical protein
VIRRDVDVRNAVGPNGCEDLLDALVVRRARLREIFFDRLDAERDDDVIGFDLDDRFL